MKSKQRLDIILVERGFFSSRERAKAAVMAGEVSVNGVREDKAGTLINSDAQISVNSAKAPFVSRGGLKLARAISVFNIDLSGKTVLDIGSSTGGFVDCALQNGAAKVYAVDVGYGQLAWSLRQDARVVVLEKTNARYLDHAQIPEEVDVITADASFISLAKVLPTPVRFLRDQGDLIALVKPQFEAGREKVGKKGVVRDKTVHYEVIENVLRDILHMCLTPLGCAYSPVTGPEGNIEYLLWARKAIKVDDCINIEYQKIVEEAWEIHKNR